MGLKKDSTILISILIILVLVGTFFYHNVENLNILDSVYFTVITLTTIGYGDIVPVTMAGKIFTMFFSLAGIAILFSVFAIVGKHVVNLELAKKMKNLRESYKRSNILFQKGSFRSVKRFKK